MNRPACLVPPLRKSECMTNQKDQTGQGTPGMAKLGRGGGICLVILAVNVVLRTALAAVFPLYYKEAYFWEWSRFLSCGYLEHPPAVAWVIRAGGLVFGGQSIFGIRFGALLFGTGSLLLIYRLAMVLFDDRRVAGRALLIALGLPLLNAVGVVMLPEAPTVFFHLLFFCLFASALRDRRNRYLYFAGLAAGAAMLSDLSFLLTPAVCLGYLLWSQQNRFWLKRPSPYVAVAISLGVCLPFIWWNANHGWATLRFNLWEVHYDKLGLSLRGAGEYIVEQLANTSLFLAVPLIGVLLVRSSRLPEAWRGPFQLLRAHAASVLAVFLIVGIVSHTHPHWTVLAYPSAAIALAALSAARPKQWLVRRVDWLIGLSVATLVLTCSAALVALFPIIEGLSADRVGKYYGSRVAEAEERLREWKEVHAQLAARLGDEWTNPETVVFTNSYRFGSMLSYYRGGRAVVNIAPLYHERTKVGDGQLYYRDWGGLRGVSGIYVGHSKRGSLEDVGRKLFGKISELAPLEIKYASGRTASYRIYRVAGFQPNANDRLWRRWATIEARANGKVSGREASYSQ